MIKNRLFIVKKLESNCFFIKSMRKNVLLYSKGFTILEALISFFITIIIVQQVFQFSAKFYCKLLNRSHYSGVFVENFAAIDHISRTIARSFEDGQDNLQFTNSQFIWRNFGDKVDLGYVCEGGKLYFVVGKYENNDWVKKRKNLISSSVKNISFSKIIDITGNNPAVVIPTYRSILCKIVFKLESIDCSLSRVILLKNGTIV
jgi:hypothetical protein